MSQMAFEVTIEDVHAVLKNHGSDVGLDSQEVHDAYYSLDLDRVSQEAMMADYLDEQTEMAHKEIARQLSNKNLC